MNTQPIQPAVNAAEPIARATIRPVRRWGWRDEVAVIADFFRNRPILVLILALQVALLATFVAALLGWIEIHPYESGLSRPANAPLTACTPY
jgi:hypothetical protein